MGGRLRGDRRGKRGLVDLFDRFAVQIGYDFQQELGIDVLDYFTGERSWHEFYAYLHELPRWGKYHSALQMDEEFARHIHELRMESKRKQAELADEEFDEEAAEKEFDVETRSPEGYTPLLSAVHTLDEHIQALTRVTIQLHSQSKPPPITKAPRPVTMIDAMEKMTERDEIHELAAAFGFGKKR